VANALGREGWTIFVRNLHREMSQEDVHDLFADFGEIRCIQLNLDKQSGNSKGYCFIEFKEKDDAFKAISEMNEKTFRDNTLKVNWAFKESK
jgi:RNA-binding protein 8A